MNIQGLGAKRRLNFDSQEIEITTPTKRIKVENANLSCFHELLFIPEIHIEIAKNMKPHVWSLLSGCCKRLFTLTQKILFLLHSSNDYNLNFPLTFLNVRLLKTDREQLKKMNIEADARDDIHLSQIQTNFSKLEKLKIDYDNSRGEIPFAYAILPVQLNLTQRFNLSTLHIINTLIPNLNFLAHCPSLEKINFHGCLISDYSGLKNCTNLTSLVLSENSNYCVNPEEFKNTKFVHVKTLALSANNYVEASFFQSFPNLEHLDLSNCKEVIEFSGYFDDYMKKGTLIYPGFPQKRFEGVVINEKGDLKGKFNFSNESLIMSEGEGKFNRQHELNGTGRLTHANGLIYSGNFKNNILEEGTIHCPGEYEYRGGIHNYLMQGIGELIFKNGLKYTGNFYNNEMIQGRILHPNGNQYEGEMRHNNQHGQGILILKNGTSFKGIFKDNDFIFGHITYPDSTQYFGHMQNGKMKGQGELIDAHGKRYSGIFKDGDLEYALIEFKNGDRYEGQLKNFKMQGMGKWYLAFGVTLQGYFENDKFIQQVALQD